MIGLALAAILLSSLYVLWYFSTKSMSYWKNQGVKQSKPWPLLGDMWVTVLRKKTFAEFVEWIYKMNPNVRYYGFYQFRVPTLLIRDPELIKQLTVKDFDHFTDHKGFIDPDADPLWGGNLFSLRGQKWREMRATLSGTFTGSKMKVMYGLMAEAAENFVKHYLNKNEDILEIEMKDSFTRYTNDIIATTAFGIKVDSLAEPNNEFYLNGKRATNFNGFLRMIKFFGYFLAPQLFKLFKISFFDKDLSLFFRSIIHETIRTREKDGIVRPDMINLLLETRKGIAKNEENSQIVDTGFATVNESTDIGKFKQKRNLTNDDITSQALIFFLAGFDGISTVMCFGSYELATNPEVQTILRNEIKEAYKKNNKKITYEILLKLKYLDMVVSEILRKWTPGVAADRVCTKPYTIQPVTPDENPVKLKVGDVLFIPSHGLHRDPAYFPDPEKFDPERFSDKNKDRIQPYTYLPFGVGPRNCIGSRFALLEVKALFFYLLLNFEIVPTKKTQIPLRLNRKSLNHTADGGFWLGLKRDPNYYD